MLQLFFETASLKELLSVCSLTAFSLEVRGIILQNLHLQTSCCNCNYISPLRQGGDFSDTVCLTYFSRVSNMSFLPEPIIAVSGVSLLSYMLHSRPVLLDLNWPP